MLLIYLPGLHPCHNIIEFDLIHNGNIPNVHQYISYDENLSDTQNIITFFNKTNVDNFENADLIILNTCHIREKATEKIYSELGRIKKKIATKTTDTTIAVAGCVAQAEGKELQRERSLWKRPMCRCWQRRKETKEKARVNKTKIPRKTMV